MSIYVMPDTETPDELPEPPDGALIMKVKITPAEEPAQEKYEKTTSTDITDMQ